MLPTADRDGLELQRMQLTETVQIAGLALQVAYDKWQLAAFTNSHAASRTLRPPVLSEMQTGSTLPELGSSTPPAAPATASSSDGSAILRTATNELLHARSLVPASGWELLADRSHLAEHSAKRSLRH